MQVSSHYFQAHNLSDAQYWHLIIMEIDDLGWPWIIIIIFIIIIIAEISKFCVLPISCIVCSMHRMTLLLLSQFCVSVCLSHSWITSKRFGIPTDGSQLLTYGPTIIDVSLARIHAYGFKCSPASKWGNFQNSEFRPICHHNLKTVQARAFVNIRH